MNIFEIVSREHQKSRKQDSTLLNFCFYQIEIKDNIIVPVYLDENAYNILGYHTYELLNTKFEELNIFDDNYRQEIYDYYKIASQNPGNYEFQTVLIHKEGHPVFVRNRGVSIQNEEGLVYKFIGYVESVSSIDLTDLQPSTTSKIIKTAHDWGSVGTFYFDLKLKKMHWSEEAKKMHGYENEPTIDEFATLIQSKEKFSTSNTIKKVVEGKHGYRSVYRYLRKNDHLKLYVLAIMFPIIDDKKNLIAISGNVINLFDHTDKIQLQHKHLPVEKPYSEEDSVFIKQHNQYVKIPIKDIVAVSSMRDYIQIYTKNRIPPYIHYTTLYKFKESLPENLFFQIHRSHIINLSMVEKVATNQIVVNDLTFPVSRNYKARLMEIIHK